MGVGEEPITNSQDEEGDEGGIEALFLHNDFELVLYKRETAFLVN